MASIEENIDFKKLLYLKQSTFSSKSSKSGRGLSGKDTPSKTLRFIYYILALKEMFEQPPPSPTPPEKNFRDVSTIFFLILAQLFNHWTRRVFLMEGGLWFFTASLLQWLPLRKSCFCSCSCSDIGNWWLLKWKCISTFTISLGEKSCSNTHMINR